MYFDDDVDRATLIKYLQTSPPYSIGKYVNSIYDGETDVESGMKLFRGQVLQWRPDDDIPGILNSRFNLRLATTRPGTIMS